MADVFIAVTRPPNADKNWPPKISPPVQNDAHEQASFGRTKTMITNDVAGIVNPSNNKAPEETVSNVEAKIKTTIGAPISNPDNFLGIATRGGTHRYPPREPLAGTPVSAGADSQILKQVGAPISNDGQHAVIYEGPQTDRPRKIAEPPSAPSAPISNENGVTFSMTNTEKKVPGMDDLTLQPSTVPVENGDLATFSKNEGSVSNEAPSIILPINGQQTYPSTDTSIGGGGDQTKLAGAADITGTGKPLNA